MAAMRCSWLCSLVMLHTSFAVSSSPGSLTQTSHKKMVVRKTSRQPPPKILATIAATGDVARKAELTADERTSAVPKAVVRKTDRAEQTSVKHAAKAVVRKSGRAQQHHIGAEAGTKTKAVVRSLKDQTLPKRVEYSKTSSFATATAQRGFQASAFVVSAVAKAVASSAEASVHVAGVAYNFTGGAANAAVEAISPVAARMAPVWITRWITDCRSAVVGKAGVLSAYFSLAAVIVLLMALVSRVAGAIGMFLMRQMVLNRELARLNDEAERAIRTTSDWEYILDALASSMLLRAHAHCPGSVIPASFFKRPDVEEQLLRLYYQLGVDSAWTSKVAKHLVCGLRCSHKEVNTSKIDDFCSVSVRDCRWLSCIPEGEMSENTFACVFRLLVVWYGAWHAVRQNISRSTTEAAAYSPSDIQTTIKVELSDNRIPFEASYRCQKRTVLTC